MRPLLSSPRSIRALLLVLSGVLVLPLLALGGYISYEFAQVETGRLVRDTARLSRELAARVDRELAQSLSVLQTLATSRSLSQGDYQDFYDRLAQLRPAHTNFVVRDRTGQQLVNTRFPRGAQLPVKQRRTADDKVLETGRPYVSGVFIGTDSKQPQVLIEVPVFIDGNIALFLSMSIEAAYIRDLITVKEATDQLIAGVLDGNGAFIARSQRHDDMVTKPAPPEFVSAARERNGTWRGTSSEGMPVLVGYTRSDLSNWIVVVGIPLRALNAPLYETLYGFGLVGALALAFAGSAALFVGRRIAGAVAALDTLAGDMARRSDVATLSTPVSEVNAVGAVLADAARHVRSTEAQFRTVFEQAAVGIKRVDIRNGSILDANDKFCRMLSYSRAELIGRAVQELTHPDDREPDRVQLAKLCEGTISEYAIDKRYRTKSGTYLWVRLTSSLSDDTAESRYRIATAEDISERKAYEQHIQFTLRELSHRTKNLLAVVQSIARQTARQSVDIADFELRFTARVQALARAHDLLVTENWQGVAMLQLIESQLQPFTNFDLRVETDGPSLTLDPAAAQHFALAFHELATNAVKYGALSTADGRVSIRWWADPPEANERSVHLEWTELGGPDVTPPTRRGFGSFVVEKMLGSGLGGTARLRFEPTGIVWSVNVPIANLKGDV